MVPWGETLPKVRELYQLWGLTLPMVVFPFSLTVMHDSLSLCVALQD